MRATEKYVSVVIPAYNEEKAITETVNRIKGVCKKIGNCEIIVVDDGSKDNTYNITKGVRGIKLFRHRGNKGKAVALNTGFKNSSGKILVTIDADLTYPEDKIPKLVEPIKNNTADMVIGSRFMYETRNMPKLNYYGNKFFSFLISFLTEEKITDGSSGMRAFRTDLLKNLDVKSKGLSWEVEMTTRSIVKGYKVLEIPIEYHHRVGSSKLKPLTDGFRFLFAILRARFF
jgi:glycosyltransferase involved in cell wall biosynthesis